LDNVAHQSADLVRQPHVVLIDLACGHQLGPFVGDEHFEIANTQFAQHGLFGFPADRFDITARVCRCTFGTNGAGDYPSRFAHCRVGPLLQRGGECDPCGQGEGPQHNREYARVPQREAHANGQSHGTAKRCARGRGHAGGTSERM
jgi:hypothetical protein